ncbi:unnamed protein product [Trichobilharzia szidati]|nr:unnamed protein product [Trichobilharzia szidati]
MQDAKSNGAVPLHYSHLIGPTKSTFCFANEWCDLQRRSTRKRFRLPLIEDIEHLRDIDNIGAFWLGYNAFFNFHNTTKLNWWYRDSVSSTLKKADMNKLKIPGGWKSSDPGGVELCSIYTVSTKTSESVDCRLLQTVLCVEVPIRPSRKHQNTDSSIIVKKFKSEKISSPSFISTTTGRDGCFLKTDITDLRRCTMELVSFLTVL